MDYVYIDGEYQYQSEKAACIRCDEADGEDIWIPKSVMEDEGDEVEGLERGDAVTLGVKSWFAEKEGLNG